MATPIYNLWCQMRFCICQASSYGYKSMYAASEDWRLDVSVWVSLGAKERERERERQLGSSLQSFVSVCLWTHFVSLQDYLEFLFACAQVSRQGRNHVFVEPKAEHGPHTGCDRVGNSMRHGLHHRHVASSFPSSPIEGMLSSTAHLFITCFMGNLWQVHSFFLNSKLQAIAPC